MDENVAAQASQLRAEIQLIAFDGQPKASGNLSLVTAFAHVPEHGDRSHSWLGRYAKPGAVAMQLGRQVILLD